MIYCENYLNETSESLDPFPPPLFFSREPLFFFHPLPLCLLRFLGLKRLEDVGHDVDTRFFFFLSFPEVGGAPFFSPVSLSLRLKDRRRFDRGKAHALAPSPLFFFFFPNMFSPFPHTVQMTCRASFPLPFLPYAVFFPLSSSSTATEA